MAHQIAVYKFAQELGMEFFQIEKTDKNFIFIMIICFLIIQLPLGSLRNIATLQYASIVGTLALGYSIIVILIEMPFYLKQHFDDEKSFPPLFVNLNWGYLDTFTAFMFGFASHMGVLQVLAELKRPTDRRTKKALKYSFILEFIVYLIITFSGFFSTFYETKGLFLYREDLKNFNPDYFMIAAKITLFICLHCKMAILYNIMRISLKSICFDNKEITFLKDFIYMFNTFLLCNILVYFQRDIIKIIGVLGGFCIVVLCLINPILIHIQLSELSHTHPKNLFRYFLLIFLCVIGIMATIKSFIDMFTGGINI
jgi:hypothetical protein